MDNYDWQSWAAITVVALTICVFGWKLFKQKKSDSACGGSCGCSKKWTEADFAHKD